MSIETIVGERNLDALNGATFDLLVIGGGIVGAGVARDAAMRGLHTLLVDRADFASGTSSKSSRLLHGGLRYLGQGRLGLVREASMEKMLLSRIAPHICQPLPFLFPVWRGVGVPLWQLSLGVRLYDLLCGGQNLGQSSTLGPDALIRIAPGLRRERLVGATRHFDAQTNDARLVIDTLRSAEACGAVLRNYTTFVSGNRSGGNWDCEVRDGIGGNTTVLNARSIVNAAGAWASRLPQSGIRLRLTKGCHAVFDRARLPIEEAIILTESNRILFVIPWGERIILGTTDTDYEGDPADARTDSSDIGYILNVVNVAFPSAHLDETDVVSSWAGVRPLIAPRRSTPGAPSEISRGHVIQMTEPGWFDVAGGKLTTYRLMAEQSVDRVGSFLGRKLPKSLTAARPLSRGPFSGVLPPPVGPDVVRECCRNEWALHLDDVLLRRTSWHFYHSNRDSIAERSAAWMGEELGWSHDEQFQELDRYRSLIKQMVQDAGKNNLGQDSRDSQD